MSLRIKIPLILMLMVAFNAALGYGIQRFVILPSFARLEYKEAQKALDRCVQGLGKEVERLDELCLEWARRDRTYAYLEAPNAAFEEANLSLAAYAANELNLIFIVDREGQVVWGRCYDLTTEEPVAMPEFPEAPWSPTHRLVRHAKASSGVAGILGAARGPMLVASRPVVRNNTTGPIRGCVIFARFLTRERIREIAEQVQVDMTIERLENAALRAEERAALRPPAGAERRVYRGGEGELLKAYAGVADVYGQTTMVVRAAVPRDILQAGRVAARYTFWSTIVIGLVVLLVLDHLLHRTVSEPLSRLTRHVIGISTSDELTVHAPVPRNDEIGALDREFNLMVQRLQGDIAERKRAEEALRQNERLAEIGQMAASVAHDIRNPLAGMSGAVQILRDGLPETDPRRDVTNEILGHVNRVENTVRGLLMFAKTWTPKKRVCDLHALIQEVVAAIQTQRNCAQVRFVFDGGPHVALADPLLLEQVFRNVVDNALDAMADAGEIRFAFDDGPRMIRITVSDSGPGIAHDVRERILDPFVSTKTAGTGLGLAICKRIVEAHAGTIAVESETDHGASVIIALPKGV